MKLFILLTFFPYLFYSHVIKPENEQEDPTKIYSKCAINGVVALTFEMKDYTYNKLDDGPHLIRTDPLLKILEDNNCKATFFINGKNYYDLSNVSVRDLLKRISDKGHEIASHSWSHLYLTKLREADIYYEMCKLSDTIFEICGKRPIYVRPPYGSHNSTVADIVGKRMGYKIITWNLDSEDYKTPAGDINKTLAIYDDKLKTDPSTTPGFISLHHDTVLNSALLANATIHKIKERGYRLVTMDECLYGN